MSPCSGGTKPQCSALHQSADRHGADHGAAHGAIEFGQCHATVGTTGAGSGFIWFHGNLRGKKNFHHFNIRYNGWVESFETGLLGKRCLKIADEEHKLEPSSMACEYDRTRDVDAMFSKLKYEI